MDHGPEFISHVLEGWDKEMEVTLYVLDPGSSWQNRRYESFNARPRDELVNNGIFTSVTEVQVLTNAYRRDYNEIRAHSSLGYQGPYELLALKVTTQSMALAWSNKYRGFYAEDSFRSQAA
jgi:transposase InsO family protein